MVAAVGMVDALPEDELVPAVAPAAVARAVEAKMVEACFCSSGQVLPLRTRFPPLNGQHLASEHCRVGMQAVQSTGSPISFSGDPA